MKYKLRFEAVDNVSGPWLWIEADSGAWDGPKLDWENHHKFKYTKYLKGRNTVFCAGGNMGMYPKLLSKIFTNVYTFEPDPYNFHCLVNNCQDESIFKINAVLGSSHKMVAIERPGLFDNAGMHRVVHMPQATVPCLMIDDFEPEHLDFLQLDIEGYESEALLGGLRLIEKFKPVISCENGNPTIETLLAPCGYQKVDHSVSDSIYAVP